MDPMIGEENRAPRRRQAEDRFGEILRAHPRHDHNRPAPGRCLGRHAAIPGLVGGR